MGEYQEELKCFLKEDIPVYGGFAFLKPNIENISNLNLIGGFLV